MVAMRQRVAVSGCCVACLVCLRRRTERRIRKQLRLMRHRQPELVSQLRKCEAGESRIGPALRTVMLDPGAGWYTRGSCARLPALDETSDAMTALLDLFFAQTEKIELWETALTIESGGDASCVPRLVAALHDSNTDRRHAAARCEVVAGGLTLGQELCNRLARPG